MHEPPSSAPAMTEPVRKRGRRPEDPAGVKKCARIVLFLTDDQRANIIAAAEEAGLSISKFVFACIKKDRGFREVVEMGGNKP